MAAPEPSPAFEALLEHLKRVRGFDFTGYKRSSLVRRIDKRMRQLHLEDYTQYLDYLEVHPEEFAPLFDTILINVTSFFRDVDSWEKLAKEVIPEYVLNRRPADPIRVWSAGCASGEEAYTLAMIFAELLGPEEFRNRVKIYATDVDEQALSKARHAAYEDREVEEVPPLYRDRYFEPLENGTAAVRKDLRRQLIFGRHDLVQDAPISRIDLLACRNTLMYFNAETQARILARFHFALNDGGVMYLGRAETMLAQRGNFAPIDLKRRISVKLSRPELRDRLLVFAQTANEPGIPSEENLRARDAAFDASPIAQIVIDREGTLHLVNERARSMFSVGMGDVGRPLQDLEVSYRPVDLRSLIDQAYAERRPISLREIEWSPKAGEVRWLETIATPLFDGLGTSVGISVSFADVSAPKRLQQELEHTNQELETAYEELQSTNEELETTNEELQSTVEELETTNEELQSTNEELETMNEELQSTNEELQTINEELRTRSDELNDVNAFMESILGSFRGAVVVVDREYTILIWNGKAEDMWGLRRDEVDGRNFFSLDIGLPVHQLKRPMRLTLVGESDGEQVIVDATNRRGKAIQCLVSCMALMGREGRQGVIVTMEQVAESLRRPLVVQDGGDQES
ncbi:MAG TPA: CheR family methyltransferase [Gemmatimonadaceae bacterium]|nr:CheR family methyltransferase [Gemmatimonadaceae bacterium]